MFAQSVGGGGGNGGFSVSGSFSGGGAISMALGGSGGGGQSGSTVVVNSTGNIETVGNGSVGIFAQSVGGGGGNGGFAASGAFAQSGTLSLALGGNGGAGASANTVHVTSDGTIVTHGNHAAGIIAQSVGGGGGNGGFSLSAAASEGASAGLSLGGSGGNGSIGDAVTVDMTGGIFTEGAFSHGIFAQSVGGGGGNGGFSISGTLTTGPGGASISLGGSGGTGQTGGTVTVNSNVGAILSGNIATIATQGKGAYGIYAQSVGGGGGSGGFSGSLAVGLGASKGTASLSLGGSGSGGGDASAVNVTSVDNILTTAKGAGGIFAQSIGGGGGDGGFSLSAALTTEEKGAAVSASFGGSGAAGGKGSTVNVDSTGIIQTGGDNASAILAQSVGGGGGNGGFSASGSIGASTGATQFSIALGGTGGGGGDADDVSVIRNGSIVTAGEKSYGIFAQSVGGGGGNGGLSFSGAFGGVDSKNFTASIGGTGGNGGNAGNVTVDSAGSIATSGLSANAIFAQSIGKGGGNGGLAISGAFGVSGEGTNLNVGLTVGGFGGGGGIGRAVNVTSNGMLSTAGDGAAAIFAQSIGGGGGNGGMAVGGLLAFYDPPGGGTTPGNIVNASVTIGGVGGTGNVGGNVFVAQSGAITTTGLESYGIFAQSLGGGGGTGGQANALSYVLGQKCPTSKIGCTPPPPGTTPAKNSNIRIVVGGEGGSGNHGGDVTVINHGSIVTTGDFSDAIFAQSVGAGGGSGGNGVIGYSGLAPADDIPVGSGLVLSAFNVAKMTRSPSVTVGGSAGASGDGHTVTVTNAGAITTLGNDTFAILAQSVGGGGGKGGQAIAGVTGTIGVGGSGGSGGDGGDVAVTNAAGATIVARGTISAAGILAQSTGGGGGIAGASSGIVGIGGAGASAGDGGAVTVTNNAGILTTGINSWGVAALSTGGGGGIGGSSLLSGLAIGGSGGSSGKGGDITVSNTGVIVTGGNSSQGILAQSVGGGGGVGGSGIGGVILGGTGGSTGDGGRVGITNTGAIVTAGIASHGVLAQSIGGGGGIGGGGSGLLTLGGNGTGGGNGGAVDLVNSGSIDTSGDLAIGLFAQSIGGGGGIGGAGASITELLNIEDPALGDVTTIPLGDPKFSAVVLGGDGGGGGNGGAVAITNNAGGAIVTRGAYAHGVFGQSVGGGGGLGGSGDGAVTYGGNGGGGGDGGAVTLANTGAVTTLGEGAIGVFGQSIGGGGGSGRNRGVGASTFGGSNGATGNGGSVSITNYVGGIIDTLGEFAHGLFAQSIGGGGGSSGSGSGALTLGGDGSNGGDGGQVTVDNRDTIVTRGANAIGLFAQSIGGGGGAAGTDGTGAATLGGGSGNGGLVGITNSGSIVTLSDGSHAIFAQSIGGGGGYVFAGAGHTLGFAAGNGSGNGAAVTITNSGDLSTSGVSAHGIFAQSIGGGGGAGGNGPYANSVGTASGFAGSTGSTGTAGDVTITHTGNISAQGVDSFGILAQSKGATGNGNLTLALNGGTIVGGSGSGAGLGLFDGTTNLVTNRAVVASASLADGYAVRATGGNDTIDNFGTMIGSVDLGAGLNSFTNRAGAAFMPGAVVALGAGNTLTNDGMISPGGLGNVMTTTITGKFAQSSTGLYAVDIDFAPNKADRIDVTETSSLAGTLAINAVNFGNAATGHHEVTIASAKGGSKGTLILDAPASAIATYQLIYPNDTDVVLAYDINYQPAGLPQQLSSITDAINRIQAAGSTPDFSKIAAALFAQPETESLTKALQMLGGEGSAVTQQVAMGTTGQFTSALGDRGGTWFNGSHDANSVSYLDANASMMSYAPRRKRRHRTTAFDRIKPPPAAVQPDRWRAWTNVFGGRRTVDGNASGTIAGMTQTNYGGMFGVDRQMNQDFLLGVAVGASSGSFNVADRATQGSVDGAQFGAYGMTRRGAWYVFGSLGYTRFANRTSRAVAGVGPTEIARGSFASDQLSGRVEVGRKSDFGRFAVTPFAALEFARLWQHAYSESTAVTSTGAPGILGLTYEAQSITSVPASLGLQIDSQFTLANRMTVTPFARAAWVHEFEADRRIVPSFNAAPGYTFVTPAVSAAVAVARFNVGATLGVTEHASFFAGFSGDFASNMESYGVTGGYRVGW
jgi:uncharacterized protein YhjY with autotransporter beta-barrel domain